MRTRFRWVPVLAWVLAFLFAGFVADAGTVRVACVGDSITYGYGLRDRQANAYPVWLGRWLGTNYDVRHFGVSATTLLHRGDYPYVGRPAYTNALEFKADRRVSVSRQFFVSYS